MKKKHSNYGNVLKAAVIGGLLIKSLKKNNEIYSLEDKIDFNNQEESTTKKVFKKIGKILFWIIFLILIIELDRK